MDEAAIGNLKRGDVIVCVDEDEEAQTFWVIKDLDKDGGCYKISSIGEQADTRVRHIKSMMQRLKDSEIELEIQPLKDYKTLVVSSKWLQKRNVVLLKEASPEEPKETE